MAVESTKVRSLHHAFAYYKCSCPLDYMDFHYYILRCIVVYQNEFSSLLSAHTCDRQKGLQERKKFVRFDINWYYFRLDSCFRNPLDFCLHACVRFLEQPLSKQFWHMRRYVDVIP